MEGDKKEMQGRRDSVTEDIWLKRVFSVTSGELYPGMVPELLEFVGNDVIVQEGVSTGILMECIVMPKR